MVESTYAYVTTLDFDETGCFLAAGYSDGTLSVYCRPKNCSKFKVYVRFVSHDCEIMKVKWCKGVSCNLLLLASDVNTTKLWKISKSGMINSANEDDHLFNIHVFIYLISHITFDFNLSNVKIVLRRIFFQAPPPGSTMNCNLHSVSLNSDGEVFLTADELRIYLWNLQAGGKECFSVLDLAAELKSLQMVTEVMRTATFHPLQCNLFVYGTSTGAVRVCDLRASALCEGLGFSLPSPSSFSSSSSHPPSSPSPKNNSLADYMLGISDLAFDTISGHLLAARDISGVTVWDLRASPLSSFSSPSFSSSSPSQYLARYSILPAFKKKLMSHLYDRYEVGAPLEKFKICFSRNQSTNSVNLITGTYDDRCVLWDLSSSSSSSSSPSSYTLDSHSSPPLSARPASHKTVHVGKPKHSNSSFFEFSEFTPSSPSLGKRRRLAKHARRKSNGGERERGRDTEEVVDIGGGEVVDIFPEMDDENGVITSSPGSGVVADYVGGGEGYLWNGEFDEYEEGQADHSGVVGVYNATPEFLAVVPFSNSCISYFTGGDDEGEEQDTPLSPLAFFSKVNTLASDESGELLAVSARGSLFVYNTNR